MSKYAEYVKALSAELAKARRRSGLTIQEVADRLCLHRATASSWLSRPALKPQDLWRLCEELEADPLRIMRAAIDETGEDDG